jgi:dipeptidyl aminopeptidase/acylaminoacyl peptidase
MIARASHAPALLALAVSAPLLALGCPAETKVPACSPVASAWAPGALPVARGATSASGSASVVEAPKEPLPTIDQLLDVKRAFAARALDDKRFLNLTDASGSAQIVTSPMCKPGAMVCDVVTPLTSYADRIANYRITPDGQRVLFLKDQGGDENDQLYLTTIPETADDKPAAPVALTAQPKVKHTAPSFDEAGKRIAFTSNARNGKDLDLYVEDLDALAKDAGQKPRKPLVELKGSHFVSDVSGDRVLVTEQRSNVDASLWLVDAKTKQKRLLTKHTGDERWEGARFSHDGKFVYALTDAGRELVALVAIELATDKRTPLLEGASEVEQFALSRPRPAGPLKGKAPPPPADVIVYSTNVDGVNEVYVATISGAGGAPRKLGAPIKTDLHGVVGSIDLAPDGSVAYVALERADLPPEIFRVFLDGGETQRATFSEHAGVDVDKLVPSETITYETFDKRKISMLWIARPLGPGQKRPVVISVHGGPEAQAQPHFSGFAQYLAQHGYGVAMPNVRGSTGYGKSFSHLDDGDKREDSVRDLSECGKFLAGRPDVDGNRIALYGGSYGGYMVLAGLTLYPDQWAAGVDVVGIANFRTFLEQTAPYRRALREAEYGSLAKDGPLLDRLSPIHKVDKIRAPLFVVHGRQDPRVPVGEAVQISDALKKRGMPVELMIFDDEGHGLSKSKNRHVAYPAITQFLDRWVRDRK